VIVAPTSEALGVKERPVPSRNVARPAAAKAKPAAPAASASAKPPAPNCTQNFYFDAKGNKHFRPECF
jgi:hypothetical protein